MRISRSAAEEVLRYRRPSVNGIICDINTTTELCTVKVQDDSEYWYGVPFAGDKRLLRIGTPVLVSFPESKRYRPVITGPATVEIRPKKLDTDGVTWVDDPVTIADSGDAIVTGMQLDVEREGYPGLNVVVTDGSYRMSGTLIAFPSGTAADYNLWGANVQPADTTVAKWGNARFWGDIGTIVGLANACSSGKQRIAAISINASQVITLSYGASVNFGTTPVAPSIGTDLLIGYVLQKGGAYGDTGAINAVLWSDLGALQAGISSSHATQNVDLFHCGIVGETYRGVGGAFITADVGDIVTNKALTLERYTSLTLEGVRAKIEIGSASTSYASIVKRPAVQWSDISGVAGPWYIQIDALPPIGLYTLSDGAGTSKRLVEVILHHDETGWETDSQFTSEYGYIEINT